MDLRAHLEDLAQRLHLADGHGAKDLRNEVQRAIDEDHHDGLRERFSEAAVHFEISHPEISEALLRVADFLSASGL